MPLRVLSSPWLLPPPLSACWEWELYLSLCRELLSTPAIPAALRRWTVDWELTPFSAANAVGWCDFSGTLSCHVPVLLCTSVVLSGGVALTLQRLLTKVNVITRCGSSSRSSAALTISHICSVKCFRSFHADKFEHQKVNFKNCKTGCKTLFSRNTDSTSNRYTIWNVVKG